MIQAGRRVGGPPGPVQGLAGRSAVVARPLGAMRTRTRHRHPLQREARGSLPATS